VALPVVFPQPGGSRFEVALFRDAGGAACRGSVAGASGGMVAGHLQEMCSNRVKAVMVGQPFVGIQRREEVESGLGSLHHRDRDRLIQGDHGGGHRVADTAADTILLGRRTYEEFAAFWPNQPSDVEFANQINNTPKVVVSTTLETVEWQNSTLIEGDVVEQLSLLKRQPGKDISITGSATLVRSLLRDGLLDELRLLVHPIVVGSGRRLFEDGGGRVPLKLVNSRTFSTGVLYLTYEPADR
jgi:dihydrofolate reductase